MVSLYKTSLLIFALIISLTTVAQNKLEFKTGVSFNSHFANDNGLAYSPTLVMKMNYGFGLEASVGKYLSKVLKLETGLEVMQLGFDVNYDQHVDSTSKTFNHKIAIIQVELPLNLNFSFPSSTNTKIFVTSGCAFRYVPYAYAKIDNQIDNVGAWVWRAHKPNGETHV